MLPCQREFTKWQSQEADLLAVTLFTIEHLMGSIVKTLDSTTLSEYVFPDVIVCPLFAGFLHCWEV